MKTPLQDKRIILGVTGSIACYKAADLASKLSQAGAQVDVLLTKPALQFITPLTFQSVTGRRAYTDADLWSSEGHVLHIGLARDADLLLVAPATANTLAKLAHGLADNLLTLIALATDCPLMVAPAMDGGMYQHPVTQQNLSILQDRQVEVIGPGEGHLASGMKGAGRMLEPHQILGYVRLALARNGPLRDNKLVITAGPTHEPLDPVRILTNRSSGKQGFELAQASLDLGAQVTLIAGSVNLNTPVGARRVDVQSAREMHDAVLSAIPNTDALIMCAAVADFTIENPANEKYKKASGLPKLALAATPDILRAVSQQRETHGWPRIVIGFAAESQDALENARKKLKVKNLDMIAVNDISSPDAGFAVDTNRVTLLFADGRKEDLPLMSKAEVAQTIMKHTSALINSKPIRGK